MKISACIDKAAAQAQLRQWGGEFRDKVKNSVAGRIPRVMAAIEGKIRVVF